MKTLLKLCALVCLLSLASFGQSVWGSLPPAADCADGFAVILKPQNPYSPQGGSFQLPGTYVCHTHVWYWQPPKVDSVSFFDATSMATATVGVLPLQTSHANQLLKTNGTVAAWSGTGFTFDASAHSLTADGVGIFNGATDASHECSKLQTIFGSSTLTATLNATSSHNAECYDATAGLTAIPTGAINIFDNSDMIPEVLFSNSAGTTAFGVLCSSGTANFCNGAEAANDITLVGIPGNIVLSTNGAGKSVKFNIENGGGVASTTPSLIDQNGLQSPGAILTAAAPTAAASQVSFGGTTAASSNCGSLAGAAGCLVINVAGTTRYVPYY